MSRALWFAAGAGASVYAMNRAKRLRENFTLNGLRDRASGVAAGARVFRDEVAQGRLAKEDELRHKLGLVPSGTPELAPGPGGRHRLDTAEPTPSPENTTNATGSLNPGTNQEGTN